ncbi:MAG: DUF2917 domain-containing protein [Gammaproteobacteria bacterium]|nr:DUF2917 domain-containing protein [Gammaproteobacteria bacterium]MBU1507734.1 DUF2917 domain-containing protein [Gammaproteobacteria bacterium]MBU2120465.1 DUF2917 domain-containing protein [Gammaproteobacteria bacterium]MBU2171315.1 DUF2917 domain-containing protein [Gammaproteobacteria bacterium]MBU2199251.1 DUF2917 domain-containing protein [Gammaproteobacteria bacterium]
MNSLHNTPTPSSPTLPTQPAVPLTLQWKRQPLPPLQAVQVLDFRAGDVALLEVEQGRVWVTCDGLLEDYFLEAGQRLSFTGPIRLRVSAEGHRPARLNWAQHRAVEGAAYPPAPAPAPATPTVTAVPATHAAGIALPRSAVSAA